MNAWFLVAMRGEEGVSEYEIHSTQFPIDHSTWSIEFFKKIFQGLVGDDYNVMCMEVWAIIPRRDDQCLEVFLNFQNFYFNFLE